MSEALRTSLRALIIKRTNLHERIAKAARATVPVMLDAGRPHSAKELQELFFELDGLNQEMLEFTTKNLEGVLKLMVGGE